MSSLSRVEGALSLRPYRPRGYALQRVLRDGTIQHLAPAPGEVLELEQAIAGCARERHAQVVDLNTGICVHYRPPRPWWAPWWTPWSR